MLLNKWNEKKNKETQDAQLAAYQSMIVDRLISVNSSDRVWLNKPQWEIDAKLQNFDTVLAEYNEIVVQFGFTTIFGL